MNLFSISHIEQYSGIKSHTIRAWEQRYAALKPTRSDGNTRYYDNSQLRRLLNIVSLQKNGYKISELGAMSDEKLFKLLEAELLKSSSQDVKYEYFITQLIAAAIDFDENHFDKIFSNCVLRLGMESTYSNVIYPMIERIGLYWLTGKPTTSYEHFTSHLIKQKLYSAIDALPPPKDQENSWLLFLPENEFHEIGLLFSYYIIKQAGKKAIYLGSNVPIEGLIEAIEKIDPAYLLFFFVHGNSPEHAQDYLNKLKTSHKKSNIFFAANEILGAKLNLGKRYRWLKSVYDLKKQLE